MASFFFLILSFLKLLEDPDKVIDKFSYCEENRTSNCMQDICTLCFKIEVDIANGNSQLSDSELEVVCQDENFSDEDYTPTFKYYKWATIDSKVHKVIVEIDL